MKTQRSFYRTTRPIWSTLLILFSVFTLFTGNLPAQAAPYLRAALSASGPTITPPTATAQPASPTAPQDTPYVMIDDYFSRYVLGGGFLYWAYDCNVGGEFNWDGWLRRKAAHGVGGTISTTLDYVPFAQCRRDDPLAADNDGAFYYNTGATRIERLGPGTPFSSTLVYTPTTAPDIGIGMVTDATYVYWIAGTQIQRAPKDGSGTGAGVVATTNAGPTSLVVSGNYAYWLDSTGLWQVDKSCTALACGSKTQLSATSGSSLIYQYHRFTVLNSAYLYWANGDKIQVYSCNIIIINGCSTGTFYTAPTTDWKVGRIASDGNNLFWVENYAQCSPFCAPSANGKLQRKALSGGTAQPIAENIGNYGESTYADTSFVYFYIQNTTTFNYNVVRLPVDATAISHDLAADKWEVTQAIQSPANDVPLVANKPTYVRAYGKQVAGTSQANTAEAYLYGTRNGSPLPGSPLKSINGARNFITGGTYDRGQRNDGWLFQLPGSWTDPSTINLQLVVDPRHLYFDPSAANNTLTGNFTFNQKAPVCIVTVPVRTHGPEASPSGSHFWFSIDMVRRLWPASNVWTYKQDSDIAELEACWWGPFPYPCFGPYEIPEDNWKILASLTVRDIFSDDPDECDNAGAETHYIGIVDPSVDTGGANGAGLMGFDQAWVKLPPLSPNTNDWNTPRAATLAHEMSHNYDRKHVNCGGPDDTDPGYPYPPCQLDNTGPDAHYGFQTTDQSVIAPDAARDFMAYGTNRWVSDYNWKSLFGKINALAADQPAAPSGAQPNLADASTVVMLTGAITPTTNQGALNYAWTVITGALSSHVLNKWQAAASPALNNSIMQPNAPLTVTYHLRLFDNNNVMLDDRVVTLQDSHIHPDNLAGVTADDSPVKNFALTFPAPVGTVARLDLLADETLLARLQPGLSMPALSIVKPAGGETFNNQMTIIWNGTDADTNDRLLFNVQYSPDNSVTWLPVANDVPGTLDTHLVTLTLNSLAGLPGSGAGQGHIRVMASDGYHTALATSAGFTVVNHPPDPFITTPGDNEVDQPGGSITLHGGATDAEDGGLSGSSLEWKINSSSVGTGTEQLVAGLAPGLYAVTLTAQDSIAQKQTVTQTLNIGTLAIPQGSEPNLDGYCDDPAYAGAVPLQLSPYADGGQSTAYLIRTATDLWVCFNGMNQKTGSSPYGLAGIGVDGDNSGGAFAQATDYRFWVTEDGTPTTDHGDGAGGYVNGGPAGLQSMISADSTFWRAELRIPASALGGWDHLVRLNVFHEWARFVGDQNRWPYASTYNGPNTWAVTFLGDFKKVYLPIVLR
jgi:hypothetical protein